MQHGHVPILKVVCLKSLLSMLSCIAGKLLEKLAQSYINKANSY